VTPGIAISLGRIVQRANVVSSTCDNVFDDTPIFRTRLSDESGERITGACAAPGSVGVWIDVTGEGCHLCMPADFHHARARRPGLNHARDRGVSEVMKAEAFVTHRRVHDPASNPLAQPMICCKSLTFLLRIVTVNMRDVSRNAADER